MVRQWRGAVRRAGRTVLCAGGLTIGALVAVGVANAENADTGTTSATVCETADTSCQETQVLGKVETSEAGSKLALGGGLVVVGAAIVARTRPNRRRLLDA